jgi:hypothetical protein
MKSAGVKVGAGGVKYRGFSFLELKIHGPMVVKK